MKRIMPACFLAMLAATPVWGAERRYSLTDFDRVQVEGPYQVTLRTGLSSGGRAQGSAAALDRVSIDVQGRTLRVRTNRSAWGGNPEQASGPVRIELTTLDLRSAAVVGAGSLDIDRAKGLRVDLSLSGSGRLNVLAVDADNFSVGLLGAGRITLGGKAKQVKATIQGSGELAASGFNADDLQLFAETSGSIAIGAQRTAKVVTSGAGNVEVSGKATCTVQARGAGQVRCGR